MNQETFLGLLRQHEGILHKICRLYRDTPEDREDLFQEIVYQLWKSYPSFQGQAKLSSWIYRIALNTALASFRKKGLRVSYPDTLPDHVAIPAPVLTEQQEQLFLALQQLSDAEKAIITLYLEDLTYQEIAAITGIDVNYVGVKLNRIKTKLKTILKS
ncbi:RNA polymerase sigma-70 factor, ECF subfamily [Chitinophaga eiseniae]|uniref:RNA polymerase sigma-70 factor, ECF subfamily n=1 Tax=Chitinophaga eiseniae TaxID=634771 RepID=A0A1T4QQ71_9BACT|nr:sigma-70 family RNA polymerase sigma factor [Chitinophaga eiseniae]SKA05767.1 RNA polymerase sigma-70 factor, ECF subfamily [Chitinophaga eiseniae]